MRNVIIFSVTSVSARQVVLNGFNNLEVCFEVVKAHHPADQVAAALELVWGNKQRSRSPGGQKMEGRGMWRGRSKVVCCVRCSILA